MEDQKLLEAKKAFEKLGHKATLVQNSDRYTIIDWRKADGGGDYYVNYIIDKKRGSLIISGDLGDCIATWYNPNTVHKIASYVRNIDYFLSKFQCASDRYIYDADQLIGDVEKALYESEQTIEWDNVEFQDEWEEFQDEVPAYLNDYGFFPNGEVEEFLIKYLGDEWWDGSNFWGRNVSPRVYLWAAGLNMAVDQLDKSGLLSAND